MGIPATINEPKSLLVIMSFQRPRVIELSITDLHALNNILVSNLLHINMLSTHLQKEMLTSKESKVESTSLNIKWEIQ